MPASRPYRFRLPRRVLNGLARLSGAVGLTVATAWAVPAADVLPGPIPALVVEVIDGDTLTVEARIWLGQNVTTRVRLAGIDTPEIRGDCDAETVLADHARRHVVDLLGQREVTLHDVRYGTYAGRVMARVEAGEAIDVAADLLAAGFALPYNGRGPRPEWCDPAAIRE